MIKTFKKVKTLADLKKALLFHKFEQVNPDVFVLNDPSFNFVVVHTLPISGVVLVTSAWRNTEYSDVSEYDPKRCYSYKEIYSKILLDIGPTKL